MRVKLPVWAWVLGGTQLAVMVPFAAWRPVRMRVPSLGVNWTKLSWICRAARLGGSQIPCCGWRGPAKLVGVKPQLTSRSGSAKGQKLAVLLAIFEPRDFFPAVRIFSLPSYPNFSYIPLNDGDLYAAAPRDGTVIAARPTASRAKQLSPLDVSLNTLRLRWHAGRIDEAVNLAKIAALCVHPKPQAREGGGLLSEMRDDQLDARCDGAVGGAEPAWAAEA